MGWATRTIQKLQAGESAQCRPPGGSMEPHVHNRQLVTIDPIKIEQVAQGDIVLCVVGGNQYLHFVHAVNSDGTVTIANAKGHVNGKTRRVFGKLKR